ncbi:microtubule-associated protein Jupiter-like isoform X1 [Tachypleus tridentatus]|uniref:microtubule-associated protein Jupiter-like isoform X1 n=1 Tax=Tachypleus tridentatus TaxID=6853 RepID=UPI003FD138B7
MSPIRNFYHVEIDKIGQGKRRVIRPLERPSSNIFDSTNDQDGLKSPAAKNYMQTSIFGSDCTSNKCHTPRRRRSDDTQNKLFGSDVTDITPRKVLDRMKSNIFMEPDPVTKPYSAKKHGPVHRNPITGEVYDTSIKLNSQISAHVNGTEPVSPLTNNRTPVSPSSPSVHVRTPPGGISSGIF